MAQSARAAVRDGVLGTQEHMLHGTGTAGWNGPNPLGLNTSQSGPTFLLRDPNITNLSCQDAANNTIFAGPDDVWGDGNPANRETGCVDALFGAQTEARMLSQWLDRNGLDGNGGAWPIRVGLDEGNAFYDGTQVQIGHNPSGQWIGSLDIVGHEMGHGVDDHTPGGLSRAGTQEFIADAFGTATEWFANEPAPFDVPDFLIGEQVKLDGLGPIRIMSDPARILHGKGCFDSSIPTDEVHRAAGPGDHWFFLVAEGSNPTDGQPVSPTCNGGSVAGIGVQRATQILYNAMLMKTTASSYQAYRTWTLTAANNLFPGNCTIYATVRDAWDAISVPPQPGDPAVCPVQANVLTGDFDGDHRADLALTGRADVTTIPMAKSVGDGSFTVTTTGTPSPFAGLTSATGATTVTGDFDGDGRTDLAVTGGRGWTAIPVALSHGDGSFVVANKPLTDFPGRAQTPGVHVVSGDFNRDGLTDIALTGGSGWTSIPVAFSNGRRHLLCDERTGVGLRQPVSHARRPGRHRRLQQRQPHRPGGTAGSGHIAVVLDAGRSLQRRWHVLGDQQLLRSPRPMVRDSQREGRHWRLQPRQPHRHRADRPVRGGRPSRLGSPTETAHSTPPTYRPRPTGTSPSGPGPWGKVISGDFNHDGLTDMALTGPAGWGSIPVAFSNGDGTFNVINASTASDWSFAQWAATPDAKVISGDFNADGRTDLALTGPATWSTIPVAFSNGDGTFHVTNTQVPDFPLRAASTVTAVPDVRFDPADIATATMRVFGLTVAQPVTIVIDCDFDGTVKTQMPSAGTPALVGSIVVLTIGQKPTHPCG